MSGKARLSKTILEMKFMKKTKEKVLKAEESQESCAMYSSEITQKMLSGSNLIPEPSYVPCEDLLIGRFSFGGMNPELERLLLKEKASQVNEDFEKEQEMIKDVSDDKMALHYGKIHQTISNKYTNQGKKFNRSRDGRIQKKSFNKDSIFKGKHT
ncbi:M-phase phosphoprotein 6 [Lutzomyia longipalpis]|uniref:M-phase phosphoprotein 6 n=1 Tax=Lutzomyia longipalpis TaxID=7200 RepID=UPI0024835412|nr:M-phase phosphoprotein 6 [Lutzomyia longipalpis]